VFDREKPTREVKAEEGEQENTIPSVREEIEVRAANRLDRLRTLFARSYSYLLLSLVMVVSQARTLLFSPSGLRTVMVKCLEKPVMTTPQAVIIK